MKKIYLDNNATTPVAPSVLQVMIQELEGPPSNPSSSHFFGQKARGLLSSARTSIATFFSVKPEELIFTSGGTESLNMTIRGLIGFPPRGHILSTSIEHISVYNTLLSLQKEGCELSLLSVGQEGAPSPAQIQQAIRSDTRLIVLTAVNTETGVKLDLEPISEIALQANIPLVIDGVGLLGKELFSIPQGITALCFSGHKIHGPKGIGLTILRSHAPFTPLLTGGPQEFQKRAGTENLAGILGFSEALRLVKESLPAASSQMEQLRNSFEEILKSRLPGVIINGTSPRIVNTSNISFRGIEGELLLIHLDRLGLCASHGSACSSQALSISRVLLNMGIDSATAKSSLRFSLSRYTTPEEIEQASAFIIEAVARLRSI